jgi:hypothetical protein
MTSQTSKASKTFLHEFGVNCSAHGAALFLLVIPLSSHAITRSEFDALGSPQYIFSRSSAECNFGSADTCASYREVNGKPVLQGTFKNGVISMENSEDPYKQKLGIVTLTLDGEFRNVQPQGIKFTPTWTGGEPSGSGAGYDDGYVHPSPNVFEISFKMIPQPKSETIDLSNLSFTNLVGAKWKLADHWGSLTSLKVETNCVPVPEPSSSLMAVAGMGLLGVMLGRRAKVAI